MKLNRKLVLFLSLVLSLALATGGTLAYLSDTDADVNTMTLGNVYIVQNEQERDDNGNLEAYENDEALYPAVYTGTSIDWAPEAEWPGEGGQAWKVVEDNELVVDKFVTVTNTGKSDAYVRTLIAYEGDETYGPEGKYIHVVHNAENVAPAITTKLEGTVVIDDVTYTVYSYTYTDAVKPGETTIPSLKQVYMDKEADNKVVEQYGDEYKIIVLSQAVQTAGFKDAKTALDTAFGEVPAKMDTWFNGNLNIGSPDGELPDGWADNNPPVFDAVPVATADELVAALEAGKDVVLTKNIKIDPANMSNAYGATGLNITKGQTLNGNGYTIDIKGAGGTWDSGINTTGGTIKNVTITGSFRGIFINHNSDHSEPVVLENVTTTNTTYTISCDQGKNQTLLATNCTFNGWTSYAGTLGSAKFVNCNFNEGRGYAYCRPYAPTEFVGCNFQEDFTVEPCAAVTFENCTIGGEPLTADNLEDLVTSTAKVTLK